MFVNLSGPAFTERLAGPLRTGIDPMMSVGTRHVTAAGPSWVTAVVVSDTMLMVMLPDAGAVTETEMSGVVSVARPTSFEFPVRNGPGLPYWIWFGWGKEVVWGVLSGVACACHCAGLVSGWWL